MGKYSQLLVLGLRLEFDNIATLIIVEAIILTLIIRVIMAIQAFFVKMGMTTAMAITSIMANSAA